MFTLANPLLLLLIFIPLLVQWGVSASNKSPIYLKIPFFSKLYSDTGVIACRSFYIGAIFWWFIWILLVFALSGPRWISPQAPLEREGRNIMLVLDISGSMALDDMILNGWPTDRLTVVKKTAREFIKQRKQDKLGLILFGSRAYLQTPLTFDHNNVQQRLKESVVGLAGQTTSIGDALGLAIQRLQDVSPKGRVIVLLTDGVNNSGVLSPLQAAEVARSENIKIYTIGLAAQSGGSRYGNPFLQMRQTSDLDEETLQAIAKETGGKYFRATDTKSLQDVYLMINTLEMARQDSTHVQPPEELYFWLVGLVCFLIMSRCGWLARGFGRRV